MHSKAKLRYTSTDRKRFAEFFEKEEKKRKVGRPRKKRRYNKKRKKRDNKKQNKVKAKRKLFDDRCAGEVAKDKRNKNKRVNWDIEPNKTYRDRCATSWIKQTDLWVVGEKFARFSTRCGIDRNVLSRYINKVKKQKAEPKSATKLAVGGKRGRKSMLSQSVMHHLCEGWFSVCVCASAPRMFITSLQCIYSCAET